MFFQRKYYLRTISAAILLLAGCIGGPAQREESFDLKISGNGIYYWKTEFTLNQWEKQFLVDNNIERFYVRLFDVDMDEEKQMLVPIATTHLTDTMPDDIEVIPVVYITISALHSGLLNACVQKCYNRIMAIVQKNRLGQIRELQLDCDWTASTEQTYFDFCKKIVRLAAKDGVEVSATIRLHQLKKAAPPVSRGVLMFYNTGSLYDSATENSILHSSDVEPYLKGTISYPIPLSFAYPTYAWGILLRDNAFTAILHKTVFSDKELYKNLGNNRFRVIKEHSLEGKQLYLDDVIRREPSDMPEIMEVKTLATKTLGAPQSTIIYHLDSLNLSTYSKEEINNIYQ